MNAFTHSWPDLKTLFIDMDGTILDLHFDNVFWMQHTPKCWGEKHGLDQQTALEQLTPKFEQHMGSLNWYCLDFWSRELGLNIAELKRDVQHLIGFLPGAEAFLSQAREDGKELVLLTNAHRDSLNLKIEHTGLDQYFDQLISSHDIGWSKEEKEFWPALMNQYSFQHSESLMIDDSLPVLEAARAYGLHTCASLAPDSQLLPKQHRAFAGVHQLTELLPNKT